MKKEIIDKEKILKCFTDALLLKNKIVSDKTEMADMYDENGFLKPRYNEESASKIMNDLEESTAKYDEAIKKYKDCFVVNLRDYCDFVVDYLKKAYNSRSSVRNERIEKTDLNLVKVEVKSDIPELGLEKKNAINIAVTDKKTDETNILKSFFAEGDIRLPLLHFSSEDSRLLVKQEKNKYSQKPFTDIAKHFMEEKYLLSENMNDENEV